MSRLADRTQRLTVALLAASVALAVPGFAGLGSSIALAAVLAAITGVLFVLRDPLGNLDPGDGRARTRHLRILWVGPLLGAVAVLVAPWASPGELQALGGLCGLIGMLNYFLRPVYAAVIGVGRYLKGALG